MARHERGGGREGGSGYDRSDGVRRGRYERGDCFGFASRSVPCVFSHVTPKRAHCPLGIPISRAYALSL
eukprot:6707360-Prymnesium_polylepis.1